MTPFDTLTTEDQKAARIRELDAQNLLFPDCDGEPMSYGTLQYFWIVLIKENLEAYYRDNPNVFVAADLLWYVNPRNDKERLAPDVLVVFGRPKGKRGSYMMWREENVPMHVVFEILSPGNTREEMEKKRQFYERYGTEEFYVYDPEENSGKLEIWLRHEGMLEPVAESEVVGFVSPRMGLRFQPDEYPMGIYRPDGERFRPIEEVFLEEAEARHQAERERQARAEAQRQAEQERQARAEAQRQAERERQARAEAQRQAEQERQARAEAQRQAEEARRLAEEQARLIAELQARLRQVGEGGSGSDSQ